MPVTKIKIRLASVKVLDDCDMFGVGEWHFNAFIDNERVGNFATEFEVATDSILTLPEAQWSAVIDVSDKEPGDSVGIAFSGVDKDVFSDDDLGRVTAVFRHPFHEPKTVVLQSPTVSGGLFFSDYEAYELTVILTIVETFATDDLTGPTAVPVTRHADGSSTLSTVGGAPVVPRIEVCPVVPVPQNQFARLPQRPVQPGGLEEGRFTVFADPPMLEGAPLNDMANPAVIPIIAEADDDFYDKAALLAITYVAPGNIDLNMLTWHVASGPAVIVGTNRGETVWVRGTGDAADTIATFEVRWDGNQVLATYRAWVGKILTVPYRINILNGTRRSSQVSAALRTPEMVNQHMDVAKVIFWQAGLRLVPDPDTTTYDGAVATDVDGVYTVTATRNSHTRNVNPNRRPAATRYNFNPGVINVVFIRSISGRNQFGVATDIQGIPMSEVSDSGSPSNSWVLPSGIPPDAAAGTVTMKTFKGERSRSRQRAPGDRTYVRARGRSNPPFAQADMDRLYAAHLPASWRGDAHQNGANLAHEMGHVLGLMHRGSGGSRRATGFKRSDDRVNSKDVKGRMRGHPWFENVMTYGIFRPSGVLANDIDLLQAAVIRQHPSITD